MNKNNKAIHLWSWHNTSSPSLNFPPFFSGSKVVDLTNTGTRVFFWKGSIPYALHPQKASALKVWSCAKLYVDPAEAGPQSPNCFFVQNHNRKTHWFFIITKSMCYFQLLCYIQKFAATPTVLSGRKSKFLHVSDATSFLFWRCHINSFMLVLFFNLLVFFNPSPPFMLHCVI